MLQRYDMAEFQAQTYACDMIDMLAGFAQDMTLPVAFRRECANDVLDRAYGKPATKTQVEIVNTEDQTGTGRTVGEDIESARLSADLYQRLNSLVAQGVSPENWPAEVRRIAGESLSYFEVDTDTTVQ